ncbi:MAG: hypothetical protein PWR06_2572 [Thermoanaerobacteraceae bacterium]|jgi:hypothetical protein|nr:hypothetical protein [Thermoanaerobacteraceae bacterium]
MAIQEKKLKCRKIVKGCAEAEAIVSNDPFCFYLIDPKTGIVIEKNHCLKGQSIANKVLVFPSGKGSSVVQVDGLYQLSLYNNLPKAMIVKDPDPVLVSAAVIMSVPLVDNLEEDPFTVISNGDTVKVDADKNEVRINKIK